MALLAIFRVIVFLHCFNATYGLFGGGGDGSSTYFMISDGSCEYEEKDVRFGGGNAGKFLKLGASYPAVFACKMEDAGAKWLRFRVNKNDGNHFSVYIGTSWQCEQGAKFTPTTLTVYE